MKNYRSKGEKLNYLIPQAGSPAADQTINSGDAVKVGDLVGFAETTGVTGQTIALCMQGVVEAKKKTGTAWDQGDKIYFDHVNEEFTKSADDGASPLVTFSQAGWAAEAAESAAALGLVKLKG